MKQNEISLKEYIKKNGKLITDGAMGTYYSIKSNNKSTISELANIEDPRLIKEIHKEYIDAGAKLIRTNTFLANCIALDISEEKRTKLLKEAYKIAKDATGDKDIFIAASIGPINTTADYTKKDIEKEYKAIINTFLDLGVNIFLFETFSSLDDIKTILKYLKTKKENSQVIVQFALMTTGQTRRGISGEKLVKKAKKMKEIDIYGFNCGTGPVHMYNNIKNIDFEDDIVSALPNAGFPEIIDRKTVYSENADYFGDRMEILFRNGVKILGGCCGTTPEHIRVLNTKLKDLSISKDKKNKPFKVKTSGIEIMSKKGEFRKKLDDDKFIIAAELDPPFSTDINKLMKAAKILKRSNVDLITVADSPIGKPRVNSVTISAKIKREIGIDVVPHICCRDRNIIALKSDLLGGHVENIRNLLLVTGDPISSSDRSEIKSVFNFNSVGLMKLVSSMNKETFKDNPYNFGGALDLNARNIKHELEKMYKKIEAGAEFFLTQPIYEEKPIKQLKKLKKKKGFKIFAGVMPLVSYRNVQFLNNELPGINIPSKYSERFKKDMSREAAERVGIDIAVDLANQIKPYADGFYFITPFNRATMIEKILLKLNL
ncbi:MAG: bifunctional homocysteine S-methyltransferase/methylenetetrahydrofolate reductase [Fusobacteriota bacterium]